MNFVCTDQYQVKVGSYWSNGPTIELLSHCYAWEEYHSFANPARGFSVPSKSFSREFDLRAISASFDQVDTNGNKASISLSPPTGFDPSGNLLYLREDLLHQYAVERNAAIVWVIWGERCLMNLGYDHPDFSRRTLWRNIQKSNLSIK